MLDKNEIANNINKLLGKSSAMRSKYLLNLKRYFDNPTLGWDALDNSETGWGIYEYDNSDNNPSINVIKSCIDTLTSSISDSKVRPYFCTVNGSFNEVVAVKQAQDYFDYIYDDKDINHKGSEIFRDACIFGRGHFFINPFTCSIERAYPWQVYLMPNEVAYNKLTRMYYERTFYPVYLLPDEVKNKVSGNTCTYGLYFDTINATCAFVINNKIEKIVKYDKEVIPLVTIYYVDPTIGMNNQSIVDILRSTQIQINNISNKIAECSRRNAALTYFVPEGSTLKQTQLNNRVGNVVTYTPGPNMTGVPVMTSTPPMIDQSYNELLEYYITKAYEMVGVSQLAAQSKKPSGIESGVALQTLEDKESARFNTQLSNYISMYTTLAKTLLKIFDDDAPILPPSKYETRIDWKEIKKLNECMKIQFSAADNLSKDPSTKLQQIQQLIQLGIIPQTQAASLIDMPDVNRGLNINNNAQKACEAIISDWIKDKIKDKENYELPAYIPIDLLKETIVNTQLSLKAADKEDNEKDIESLNDLFDIVLTNEEEITGSYEGIEETPQEMADMPNSVMTPTQSATPDKLVGEWGSSEMDEV